MESRLAQLMLLHEKRLKAMYYMQLYQKRIARDYNKKIKLEKIKEGELVLKHTKPLLTNPRGKFNPN